jgi:Rab3 GTPase-activating protein catalytic subunit
MTNEEVFDDDFYQEDFSSASIWEAFISQLGEILENYEIVDEEPLKPNELSLCEWTEEKEEVQFNDFDLVVTRYKAKVPARDGESTKSLNQVFLDLSSQDNDYSLLDVNYLRHDYEVINAPKPPSIHPVAVFYGLRDFVVVKSKRKSLTDVSQIKLLQSSLSLAVNEAKCKIPAFIQVLYHEQDVFLGLYENGEQRISFDIVHLKTPPPSCKYLSGLLDMFKGKIGVSYVNPVMVSVSLVYSLKNFLSATYTSDKKSDNDDWDVVDFVNVISTLPFGVSADPVSGEYIDRFFSISLETNSKLKIAFLFSFRTFAIHKMASGQRERSL